MLEFNLRLAQKCCNISTLIKKICRKSKGAVDDFKVFKNNINNFYYSNNFTNFLLKRLAM